MRSSVELTQDLVRFRTINPPGDERACVERLASLLEIRQPRPFWCGRAQLVARIGGTSGRLPIGFTGHLDTSSGRANWPSHIRRMNFALCRVSSRRPKSIPG